MRWQDYKSKHLGEASVTWQTVALKCEVACLMTSPSVHTGRWRTRHIDGLTETPCIAWLALASVRAGQVDTGPTVLTKAWCGAFVHVYLTLVASVARHADAGELISRYSTCTSIGTRLRRTGIDPLAILSCRIKTESCINKKLFLWKTVFPPRYLNIITGKVMSAFCSLVFERNRFADYSKKSFYLQGSSNI